MVEDPTKTPRPPWRLVIADDHALVREGTQAMLANEADLEVVGEAENGREALERCRELRPDLVLMDVRMPEMDGLEATRAIKAERPSTSVLIVTTHESQDYLMDAIRAGAAGYVLKDSTKRELTGAIRAALDGEPTLDRKLAAQLLKRLVGEADRPREGQEEPPDPRQERREPALEPPAGPLTARELDLLRLLATGKTNRQIAGSS